MRTSLDRLVKDGWVAKRSKQRLDSTHVCGLLSHMSRLECVRETIRLALNIWNAVNSCRVLDDAVGSLCREQGGPSLYGGSVEDQVSASRQGYVHDPGMGEHARRSDQRRRVDTSCSTGV